MSASTDIEHVTDHHDHQDHVYRESDRSYLSQAFLTTLSLVMLVGGWVWGTVLIATYGVNPEVIPWVPPIVLMVSGYACYRLREEHLSLSVLINLVGLIVSCWMALLIYGKPEFAYALVLPVLVAGVIAGRWGVVATSVACGAVVVTVASFLDLGIEAMRMQLLVLGASSGIAWMLAQYIHVALDLSAQSRRRALSEMRKAQARRAELRRANRALDESNMRLQRLNRELLSTRRQAEDARRLREEFAANVSHELRTPINLIVGFTEMMVTAPESYGGEALPSGYWGDVQAVHRSARHLQGLIDDILDLSRIDARQLDLHRQELAAADLVQEACDVVRDLVERKGLDLRVQVAQGLPAIYVDRTRIRQVLLNLISNAVRFTDNGSITVSCRLASHGEMGSAGQAAPESDDTERASFVCMSVHDTGVGILPDDIPKVFEKFRQLDGSTNRRHGGAGLGLSISKQFVELHGGWMWVESVVGEGSTFSFVLPLFDANWSRPAAVKTSPLGEGAHMQGTVLVVDRDPRSTRLLQRHLPELRVVGTQQARDIQSALMTHVPDLVLVTDGRQPDSIWEGIPSHDPLRRAHVTVLAGHLRTERRAGQGGWADFLLKPVDRDQLIEAVAKWPLATGCVLVVEDEPDMARLITRLLASWRDDLTLTRAYSAEEARQRARLSEPDLVLLDLGLPDESGYDLLSWLRENCSPDIPVIVVTGDADTEMVEAVEMNHLVVAHQDGFRAQEFLGLVRNMTRDFPSRYMPRRAQANGTEAKPIQPEEGSDDESGI